MPASTLPEWMQGWVAINPVTHIINAVRGLFLGQSALPDGVTVWGEVGWVAVACVVIAGIFAPLATWAYRRKI